VKARLIFNPDAGGQRCASRLDAIAPRIHAAWPGMEWVRSESAEHVTEVARDTSRAKYDLLLVAGGDGTVHHAARALAGSRTALGILPLGTGNDVATSVGIPAQPEEAVRTLALGQVRRFDLARVHDRIFCCVLGVGMDTAALRVINRTRLIRRGRLLYNWAAARTLLTHRPPLLQIRTRSTSFDGPLLFAAVMNTRTYAGGMRLAPDAAIDDALLDACILEDAGLLANARSLMRAMGGRHRGCPEITLARDSSVVMEGPDPVPITLDGELTDLRTPCEVIVLPGALRLLGSAA
jgi:diacylglycerol kinase (ATP)